MKYQTVLFDLDGTLLDTKPGIIKSLKLTFREMSLILPPDDKLDAFVGPPLTQSLTEVCGLDSETASEAARLYRKYLLDRGYLFDCTVYSGIKELLESLRGAGLKLCVATSKVECFAEMMLKHHGLYDYFSAVSGSPAGVPSANKAYSINRALKLMGNVEKNTSVLIGDRKFDAQGAQQVGISSIGVLFGYGTREELEVSGFDYIVETVDGLKALLLS
jgi:phosphoglycolate phosphatase